MSGQNDVGIEDELWPHLVSLHRQGIHADFSTKIKTPVDRRILPHASQGSSQRWRVAPQAIFSQVDADEALEEAAFVLGMCQRLLEEFPGQDSRASPPQQRR